MVLESYDFNQIGSALLTFRIFDAFFNDFFEPVNNKLFPECWISFERVTKLLVGLIFILKSFKLEECERESKLSTVWILFDA